MFRFDNVKSLMVNGVEIKELSINGVQVWTAGNIPAEYQEVEWIKAEKDVEAFIDLGFTFDTAATIYIEQFLDDAPQWIYNEATYLFGAADSTGIYRCMLTSPNNIHGSFVYGSGGSDYVSANAKNIYQGKNRLKIVQKPGELYFENLDTEEKSSSSYTNIAYTADDNLYLLAQNYKGTARFNASNGHERCVGRFSYYDKNDTLVCDLYPCYRKSDGMIGMYDKVRSLFLANEGTGSFTKGANV